MQRRSTRLANKSKITYSEKKAPRKRYRITLTVTVAHYAKGGTMKNVYGEPILREGTGRVVENRTITVDGYDRDDGMLEQPPPGIGYSAITNEHFTAITTCDLMHPEDVQRIVREQFKTMHAYTWLDSVAFSNPRYTVEEVNKEGVLRKGRVPREIPMRRAAPLRIPHLKHNVAAVSLKTLAGEETCVPVAVYTWLMERKARNPDKNGAYMPKEACETYPGALPKVKDAKGHVSKPKVTPETVTKLLDAIHAASNHPSDVGHTVADVEAFCRLFACKMYAQDHNGTIIGEVIDGDIHTPLCFTNAHGHMYWHCDKEALKSISESARRQRNLGCRHFVGGGDATPKKEVSSVVRLVTWEEARDLLETEEIAENTILLVKYMKDVEQIFFDFGWKHSQPLRHKESEKRIRQFTFQLPSEVQVTVGADPLYEMAHRADVNCEDFDHMVVFNACKDNGILVDPLHGLGNVSRSILRPHRKRVTMEERVALYENQNHACARCSYVFDDAKNGSHVDHIKPLGNGGADEMTNKQLLCTTCHEAKTAEENAIGYSSDLTHSSRFNLCVLNEVILTPQFQCLEFVEGWWPFVGLRVVHRETQKFLGTITKMRDLDGMWTITTESHGDVRRIMSSFSPENLAVLAEHPNASDAFRGDVQRDGNVVLRSIDVKGCRRNGILNPRSEWAVFTALDHVEAFSGTLQENAIYFVNTLRGFPWHGRKWYRYAMVTWGLVKGHITMAQIEMELVATSTLPKDYFRTRVERLETPFHENAYLKKLFPLLDIGCMGRKQQTTTRRLFSLSEEEAAGKVQFDDTGFTANVHRARELPDGRELWCTEYEFECTQDAYALPIYEQIKEEEAMNVYEAYEMVVAGGGFPMEVKTDAIVYAVVPKEGAHPIATPHVYDGMPFPDIFWDEEKTIPKFKFETPTFLKAERSDRTILSAPCAIVPEPLRFTKVWKDDLDFMTEEVRDHTNWGRNYIREGKRGVYVAGAAGTGKTHVSRSMIEEAKRLYTEEGVLVLGATNKAARLIGGITIHKFFKRFDTKMRASWKSRVALQRELVALRYIFVDEISMNHSWFWGKLCSLRATFPHLLFVMIGDFSQLPPVADVKEGIRYEDNAALHYLVDGKRFQLTQCRRADKTFFELCMDVRTGGSLDVTKFPVTLETMVNLSYYNATRKRVNSEREVVFNQGREISPPILAARSLPRSQDAALSVGYPLISRTNGGDQNKNDRWVVTELGDDGFTAQRIAMEYDGDDEQPLVTIKYVAFHHHFEPGFCITVHAGQGDTIRVPFTIFDLDSMTTEMRYTAITRASSADLVQIDTKRANTFSDGSTFEEKADDERYVAWATKQCAPSAESVLGRFLQFVDDRSTAGLEETLVDETNDEEKEEEEDEVSMPPVGRSTTAWVPAPKRQVVEEEDAHIVRLREAQKRQRDEAGPSGLPARKKKKPMLSMADLKAARDATWNVPV